nr:immunoglobulin heavy chain junction region [Macaca mulatta]MOX67158.1 immunoglobulin heavy chain junction region [Macaca mulatta]
CARDRIHYGLDSW